MLTLTAILHVCSGSLAATRKGHSRVRHFGTTFTSWCKIFFACGGQHMNFLSRFGPGSGPGRAESQLASELGELPLLGPRRAARVARMARARAHWRQWRQRRSRGSFHGPQLVLRLLQCNRRWGSIPQWACLRAPRRRLPREPQRARSASRAGRLHVVGRVHVCVVSRLLRALCVDRRASVPGARDARTRRRARWCATCRTRRPCWRARSRDVRSLIGAHAGPDGCVHKVPSRVRGPVHVLVQ